MTRIKLQVTALWTPILGALILPQIVLGHPVAFQGATALQYFTDDFSREAQVYHSLTPRMSLGGRYIDFSLPGRESRVALLGANTLLKRWNNPNSQGNLYFSTAFGGETLKSPGSSSSGIGLFEIDADWESRRYYAAGSAKFLTFSSFGPVHIFTTRAGVAPYEAEYNQLQTWLILEASRITESKVAAQITPLLRFYYRNILWETGRSFDGMWKFNFMVHL